MLRLVGWLLFAGGGLLGLVALAAAVWFVFMTGAIWLAGGKLTEGLGSLLIGVVIVLIALLLGALALASGFMLLGMTAN